MIEERICRRSRTFTFQLNRKSIMLGDHQIDHWWMPQTSIFNQRQSRTENGNHRQLIEAAWWVLRRLNRPLLRDEFEAYALARLLPRVRSQGSRRISNDAIPTRSGLSGKTLRRSVIAELNVMLEHGVKPMTVLKFSRQSGSVIGPGATSPAEAALYRCMARDLFDTLRPRRTLDPEVYYEYALSTWERFQRMYGRRRGYQLEKRVLDMISYDARAAMVAWYSDVWADLLLPHLAEKHRFNDSTRRFLHLWHVEQRWPSKQFDDQDFHLFHGQVFALHPAAGLFIETAAGQQLIGRWLSCSKEGPGTLAFRSFLGGMNLAVFEFHRLHRDAEEERASRFVRRRNCVELPAAPSDVRDYEP